MWLSGDRSDDGWVWTLSAMTPWRVCAAEMPTKWCPSTGGSPAPAFRTAIPGTFKTESSAFGVGSVEVEIWLRHLANGTTKLCHTVRSREKTSVSICAFVFGQAAPRSRRLVDAEGVCPTRGDHRAACADGLGVGFAVGPVQAPLGLRVEEPGAVHTST